MDANRNQTEKRQSFKHVDFMICDLHGCIMYNLTKVIQIVKLHQKYLKSQYAHFEWFTYPLHDFKTPLSENLFKSYLIKCVFAEQFDRRFDPPPALPSPRSPRLKVQGIPRCFESPRRKRLTSSPMKIIVW
jgi:hypothetical protein